MLEAAKKGSSEEYSYACQHGVEKKLLCVRVVKFERFMEVEVEHLLSACLLSSETSDYLRALVLSLLTHVNSNRDEDLRRIEERLSGHAHFSQRSILHILV